MAKKGWQDDARESAHRIWLAGLGALAKAEEEGSKLFKNLVREGERYETAGKATVKSGIGGAKRQRCDDRGRFHHVSPKEGRPGTAAPDQYGPAFEARARWRHVGPVSDWTQGPLRDRFARGVSHEVAP